MLAVGLLSKLTEAFTGRTTVLTEQLNAERANVELYRSQRDELSESLRELVPDDIGWRQLTAGEVDEFTSEERRRVRALCRLMAIKSPLIKRGLGLRYVYVHGRGVQIAAKANGKAPGEQDVNAVIQAFLDDPINAKVFGQQAAEVNERTLGTDGDVFFALWTSPVAGTVRVRKLPVDEIQDIITNPDDAAEVWFYRRVWTRRTFDPATRTHATEQREAYFPDVHYTPRQKLRSIGGSPVVWDAPVIHAKVNAPDGWQFGIPDAFAACDWALAYKTFLTDWARLMQSLSRYAWKATAKGSKAAAVAAKVAAAPSLDRAGAPNAAGATVVMGPDTDLAAIPKTGATIDSESGRPLATMVAAALDVPVTMLLGDPGVTGARATAETLDDPLRLTMEGRRDLWTWLYTTVCNYVIDQAVKAPGGKLQGAPMVNEYDREVITLAGDTDRTIDITWPELEHTDPVTMIDAIVKADQTGKLPELLVARLLLEILGVPDIDEVLEELTDEEGRFKPPESAAGQAAVDAFRQGRDPAALLAGPRVDDDEPAEEEVPA